MTKHLFSTLATVPGCAANCHQSPVSEVGVFAFEGNKQDMSTITFGSLFAGIGGFDLGLERAGMVCKWQVEIDTFCQKVLAKHWPNIRRYGDVRKCGKHNLEAVDLIAGGFPCQPHSVAGKRKGARDDRNLWPEYHRIITELRPRYVLAENVPGIITTYIDTVLSDLESQAYTCTTFNIPACAIDAPHRRERVFIVAHAKIESCDTGNGRRSIAERFAFRGRSSIDGSAWAIEPAVGRVADGIPYGLDRLRALGNAVVPQVAEWIGRRIMEWEGNHNCKR